MPDAINPCHKQPKPLRPKWGKPVKPTSEKRRGSFDVIANQKAAALKHAGNCVLHGEADKPCRGRLTVHHARKASAGGGWQLENLHALCWFHNTDIEDRPDYYRSNWPWLVVREGDEAWDRLGRRKR